MQIIIIVLVLVEINRGVKFLEVSAFVFWHLCWLAWSVALGGWVLFGLSVCVCVCVIHVFGWW